MGSTRGGVMPGLFARRQRPEMREKRNARTKPGTALPPPTHPPTHTHTHHVQLPHDLRYLPWRLVFCRACGVCLAR